MVGNRNCGIISEVSICNTGIPYEGHFVPWLLHFWSMSVLMVWGKQWEAYSSPWSHAIHVEDPEKASGCQQWSDSRHEGHILNDPVN